MDRLWPATDAPSVADLEQFYAYPENLDRPWVRVNFVSSLDGAVALEGRSRGLSSPDDQRVLVLVRDLADVVLTGAGTAMIEGYRGVKRTEVRRHRRSRFGLSDVPPVAVVTRRASLPVDAPLLADTLVPPIVLTCRAAPEQRREALAAAGADVVLCGDHEVELRTALDALADRGLRRIACEGGPTLFGSLIEADLVDDLCLTVSPLLAGGDSGRIAHGALPAQPRSMRLRSALRADTSLLLLRYEKMSA